MLMQLLCQAHILAESCFGLRSIFRGGSYFLSHSFAAWVGGSAFVRICLDLASPRLFGDLRPDSAADQGFPYVAIRWMLRWSGLPCLFFAFHALGDHILRTSPSGPDACRQSCLQEPLCVAWEVCPRHEAARKHGRERKRRYVSQRIWHDAPRFGQAGCDGCYLISHVTTAPIHIAGWHAQS